MRAMPFAFLLLGVSALYFVCRRQLRTATCPRYLSVLLSLDFSAAVSSSLTFITGLTDI